ncbi:MAG TPA: hypothetical protein VLU46_08910 [Thermoanaerobaculia bacterium]|nr:hypothetical protein [Thermoanaerobaculia bacterium]
MGRSGRQRGESQFGCLLGLVFLAVAIFVAYKIIPVKIRAAEIRQETIDQAKAAGMRGDDKIIYAITQKAEENHIPLTSDNIIIRRGANDIQIDVDYTVSIDFPGYKYNWHFHHTAANPLF